MDKLYNEPFEEILLIQMHNKQSSERLLSFKTENKKQKRLNLILQTQLQLRN